MRRLIFITCAFATAAVAAARLAHNALAQAATVSPSRKQQA